MRTLYVLLVVLLLSCNEDKISIVVPLVPNEPSDSTDTTPPPPIQVPGDPLFKKWKIKKWWVNFQGIQFDLLQDGRPECSVNFMVEFKTDSSYVSQSLAPAPNCEAYYPAAGTFYRESSFMYIDDVRYQVRTLNDTLFEYRGAIFHDGAPIWYEYTFERLD